MNPEYEVDRQILSEIPIPSCPAVSGWKELPIAECDEKLVPIGLGTNYDEILTDPVYFGWTSTSPYQVGELSGSLMAIFVRESVASKLKSVASKLPPNLRLVVLDAFRPLEVQQALYDQYYNQLKQECPNLIPDQLSEETQKFVSLPSTDPTKPSPHNTGGAVDVALVEIVQSFSLRLKLIERELARPGNLKQKVDLGREKIAVIKEGAKMLNFGTNFDWGGERSALEFFEQRNRLKDLTKEEIEALKNRRCLYHLMKRVGFEAYPDEWWHFNDTGTQMGAKSGGLATAKYGRAVMTDDMKQYDERLKEWLMRANFSVGVEPVPGYENVYWVNFSKRENIWPNDWGNFPIAERIKPE